MNNQEIVRGTVYNKCFDVNFPTCYQLLPWWSGYNAWSALNSAKPQSLDFCVIQSFDKKTGKTNYHEPTFQGLDFILNEARLNGMKVILSLINNWQYHNGVGEFVDWGSTVPERVGPIPKPAGDPQIMPVGLSHNWMSIQCME